MVPPIRDEAAFRLRLPARPEVGAKLFIVTAIVIMTAIERAIRVQLGLQ
jgi:hypothetical protein